jgi:hypothetical protein
LVSLATHIAFWRKREEKKLPEPERIIPLPNLSGQSLDTRPITSAEAVNNAREALKVMKLERQILGSAVTTIYESHSKGVISETERDQMLEKYKVDLKRLEKGIAENQQLVELHDLEIEREEVIKRFKAKLAEIDARLKDLKSGSITHKPENPVSDTHSTNSDRSNGSNSSESHEHEPDENLDQQAVNESETRIDQIREEILKAMDRLEQIETEG